MGFRRFQLGVFGALGTALLLPAVGVALAVVRGHGARRVARHGPDLVVSTVKVRVGQLTVGGAVTALVRTANVGTTGAKRSWTGLYLSHDAKKSHDDIRLGVVTVPGLLPHKAKLATIHGTVPHASLPGGYRILACADYTGRVHERNERNNCRVASSTVVVLAAATSSVTTGGTTGATTGGTGATSGGTTGTGCVPTGPDPPDPEFKDSNCDGIDGEASHAIFVSGIGSDSNPGTETQPKQTLAAAVAAAAAQGKDVYATLGDYHETLVVVNGVSVYGGYDTNWKRSLSNVTRILGSVSLAGDTEAARAFNVTAPTTLQLLRLSPGTPHTGRSSYGLRGVKASGLRLELLSVTAAAGAAGANGANGTEGAAGEGGQSAKPGVPGEGGKSPAGHPGGKGGRGGFNGEEGEEGGPGQLTSPDVWGLMGGPGGPGGAAESANKGGSGYAGDFGHSGVNGSGGGTGNAAEGSGVWISHNGGGGEAGSGGHGGGGGGGGGSENEGPVSENSAGGAGGGGGGGGQGGGGSFGIFLLESAGAFVEDSTVSASDGGGGGAGGGGAKGGTGGSIGFGGPPHNSAGGGGAGGSGGTGGAGGDGGGGSGGPSVGIFGLTEADAFGTVVSHGSGGAGGAGGLGTGFGAPAGASGVSADYM